MAIPTILKLIFVLGIFHAALGFHIVGISTTADKGVYLSTFDAEKDNVFQMTRVPNPPRLQNQKRNVTIYWSSYRSNVVTMTDDGIAMLQLRRLCVPVRACEFFNIESNHPFLLPMVYKNKGKYVPPFSIEGFQPCQIHDTRESYMMGNNKQLYTLRIRESDNGMELSQIYYINDQYCGMKKIANVPAMRRWSSPSLVGDTIYYVDKNFTLICFSLTHGNYSKVLLPVDPMFNFGWSSAVNYDPRSRFTYITNANKDRVNSLWRVDDRNNFKLLSAGTEGRTNIAMALSGEGRSRILKESKFYTFSYKYLQEWDLETLDRGRTTRYPNFQFHPPYSIDYDDN